MCDCGTASAASTRRYTTPRHLHPDVKQSHRRDVPVSDGQLVVEDFPLAFSGYTYSHSKLAYVVGRSPLPVVLVHANYAGLKQFDVDVASFLARSGYVGLAVDLYKDEPGEYEYRDRDPKLHLGIHSAEQETEMFERHRLGSSKAMDRLLREPKHWRDLMKAYLHAAYEHPAVLRGYGGAIGYCLGGQCVLEQVRAGHQIQIAVSFHGLYHSRPRHTSIDRRLTKEEFDREVNLAPNVYSTSCTVLIEHGDHDVRPGRDVESIIEFKHEMDSQGIDWRFNVHARTPHGFALAPGLWSSAYTEHADRRSTLSMLSAFGETWPFVPQFPVRANACGTLLGQRIDLMRAKL
eukprot:TRINITY_DN63256_c0_g1_i1.p1 TRINITY_DN63256_c0_g1~~TRINITY_DN63256_c0_g1_i1.p1  ORF type:complete len:348 (+),score=11.41 TRINITY_DN63256_c0_g1_i1:144-1187(+)